MGRRTPQTWRGCISASARVSKTSRGNSKGLSESVTALEVYLPDSTLTANEQAWYALDARVSPYGLKGNGSCNDSDLAPLPGLKVVRYLRDPSVVAEFVVQDGRFHQQAALVLRRAGEPYDWDLGNSIRLVVPTERMERVRELLRDDPTLSGWFSGEFRGRYAYGYGDIGD